MTEVTQLTWWEDIDGTDRAADYLTYLDLTDSFYRDARPNTYRTLTGITGLGVEVGSGNGTAVHDLHVRGLQVVGIDPTEAFVAAARTRYPEADYRVGTAYALPFEDGSLSFYRAERVLANLADPVAAMAEAHRVLKPGAPVVTIDPEFDTIVFPNIYADLTREAVACVAARTPHGPSGVRVPDLLIGAGFTDVRVTAVAHTVTDLEVANAAFINRALHAAVSAGTLDTAQVDAIRADLAVRAERGTFVFAFLSFVTRARHA